ncbi:hypothetical protein Ga0466249_000499 [Sporomusaceae bacterium BoRhaA]|nr:hypothetical protein [Pelorhabdus rhamnosifermentans]MBU2699420.1 hypothetical protein [Pelorhabdus rhamnosifermentans]
MNSTIVKRIIRVSYDCIPVFISNTACKDIRVNEKLAAFSYSIPQL